MRATDLPEAWEIVELERLRRERESGWDERPALWLPIPPPRPPAAAPEPAEPAPGSTVIVIELA